VTVIHAILPPCSSRREFSAFPNKAASGAVCVWKSLSNTSYGFTPASISSAMIRCVSGEILV